MRSLTLFILPILAYTVLYTRRINGATIVQDIENIDRSVKSLTLSTKAFSTESLSVAITAGAPVLRDLLTVHIYNRKGYLDAKIASNFTAEESAKIVDTVTRTVAISIPKSVELLEAKKAEFEKLGITAIVSNSMRRLMGYHDTFSEAVMEKAGALSTQKRNEGERGVKVIHDALEEKIRALEK